MSRSIPTLANPKLIKWARTTAGEELPEAAGGIGVSEDRLLSWETGEARPSLAQLRKIAHAYRRPLAFFYLPSEPDEPPALRDFRRLPPGLGKDFSPKLRFLIRSVRERQEWLIDLAREQRFTPVSLVGSASIGQDVAALAQRLRQTLGITPEVQRSWKSADDASRGWLSAVESAGIYVLQASDVDVAEMRGFSLIDPLVPMIVINASDARSARTFTLMHELAHVLISAGGISNLIPRRNGKTEEDAIEVFCNAFAGEILVPAEQLSGELIGSGSDDIDKVIERLFTGYRVSKEVIARRLMDIGRITSRQYEERRKRYQKEFADVKETRRRKGTFRLSRAVLVLRDNGRALTGKVLAAYADGLIDARGVSQLLNVKLKHLGRLQDAIYPITRGA